MRTLIRLSVLISLAPVLFLTYYFGSSSVSAVLQARRIRKAVPFASITPKPLTDEAVAMGEGRKLSYFGYEFEVPWNDLDEAASKVKYNRMSGDDAAEMVWRSGRKVTFSVRREVPGANSEAATYDLMRDALETTPEKVSLFSAPTRTRSKGLLLTFKADAFGPLYDSSSTVYSIDTRQFRGFEFVTWPNVPDHIRIQLFSPDRRFWFEFEQADVSSPRITQAEINRVLQTLRRIR